ncbi:MAG: tRNA (adenosine(37)-N6)-dimethylallyltransferase MiaA [Candidatus Hydromicrobium sp.]
MKIIKKTDLNLIKSKLKNIYINLNELLEELINQKKVIVICGPTCTGKSRIGIILAKLFNTDIISVDSMQVYRGMDIGTDKYNAEDYGIKQFMTDIFEPDHSLSVIEFKDMCRDIIEKNFFYTSKIPLLVGGSGLYIRGVINDMDTVPGENKSVRKRLEEEIKNKGLKKYYLKLKKIDEKYAKKISENDQRRIIRALEVYEITGLPFSDLQNSWKNKKSTYKAILIGLKMEREKLYSLIDNRVEEMFSRGLVKEVKSLIEKGYKDCNSILQAVGYKEVVKYLNWEISLHECIDEVKRNTRRLAKKQMTWFKSDQGIKWIRTDSYGNIIDLIVDILSIINNSVVN